MERDKEVNDCMDAVKNPGTQSFERSSLLKQEEELVERISRLSLSDNQVHHSKCHKPCQRVSL